MHTGRPSLTVVILLAAGTSPAQGQMRFEIQRLLQAPVIGQSHPDAQDNKYGFEGGSVVKLDGTYHMFVAEMAGDPFWARMRLAHWRSSDAIQWKRVATIKETSGKPRAQTGLPYESVWASMPIYNDAEGRWDLFYVAYDQGGWTGGRIWRATSTTAGRAGIGGPYKDVGIILQPDAQSQPWEGIQGVDSFFPYRAGDRWYGYYGSSDTKTWWKIGLAEADSLAGPWKRRPTGNPLAIEPVFLENPIVTRLKDRYVAVYDCTTRGARTYEANGHVVGFTESEDGLRWTPGGRITVQPEGPAHWSKDIRTPLCLINEGNDVFTLLYTGEEKQRRFWPVGMVRLKLVR